MIEFLKKIPLFSSMSDNDLDAINAVAIEKKYPRDHMILLENDEGDALFIMIRGKVKVATYSESGKEVIYSILNEGDFFGELSLLDGKPRSASVITVEESEVRIIRRPDFFSLLEHHPGIALSLLEVLAARLRRADERIESLSVHDVTGRIAGILLQFADENGEVSDRGILIRRRPTHQELSNMAGTTRETVTRVLKQMERNSYIAMSGKSITIVDPERFKRELYM